MLGFMTALNLIIQVRRPNLLPQGRLIKGEDLCQSLDRMYNAPFARKLDGPTGSERPAPGAMPTKILSQSEYEDMVSR
jgi:hypothetical protein